MVNMMKLMKQASDMQRNMQKLQEELGSKEFEFSAGGGAVKAVVSGEMNLKSVVIDPKVVDPSDVDMLQDLVLTAVNGALQAARDASAQAMSKVTGGMSIPGLM